MANNENKSIPSSQHVFMYSPIKCFSPPPISSGSSSDQPSPEYDAQMRLKKCLKDHFNNTDKQLKIALYHIIYKRENQEAACVLEALRQKEKRGEGRRLTTT